MLNEGRWNGRPLISAEWMPAANPATTDAANAEATRELKARSSGCAVRFHKMPWLKAGSPFMAPNAAVIRHRRQSLSNGNRWFAWSQQ